MFELVKELVVDGRAALDWVSAAIEVVAQTESEEEKARKRKQAVEETRDRKRRREETEQEEEVGFLEFHAVTTNNVGVLEWLVKKQGRAVTAGMCTAAAMSGSLEALMWLREHGCPWDYNRIAQSARSRGHDRVSEWLEHNF